MQKCPVCGTIEENVGQNYCLKCAWEFEYYFDELSEEERKKYLDRLKIAQANYKHSVDNRNEEIKDLENKTEKLKSTSKLNFMGTDYIADLQEDIKNKKKNLKELKKKAKIKNIKENGSVFRAIKWFLISSFLIFFSIAIFEAKHISFLGEYGDNESGFIIGTIISIFIFLYLYIKNDIFSSVEASIYWIGISIGITFSSILIFDELNIQYLYHLRDDVNGLVTGSILSLVIGIFMSFKRRKIKESGFGLFMQWLIFTILLAILGFNIGRYIFFHRGLDDDYFLYSYQGNGIVVASIISIFIGIIFIKKIKSQKQKEKQ